MSAAQGPLPQQVQPALAWLAQKSTRRDRENLARFGINASNGAASAPSSRSAPPLLCSPASPRKPTPHRTRRHRRAKFRQEGRELGSSPDRPSDYFITDKYSAQGPTSRL